jgi:hypothetical protein
MALQYVGGTSGTGTSNGYTVSLSGTLTGGVASSPAAGDVVVVASAFGNTASSAPAVSGNNSGAYLTAGAAVHSNDTWDTEFRAFYQVMGSTPDTSLTITRVANAAYGGATVVHVWRGVDATTPLDATGTPASGGNGAGANPPSVTPTTAGSIVIAMGAGTFAAADTSSYTGFTGYSNTVTAHGNGSTSDTGVVMASVAWTSGAVDPPVASGGTQNNGSSSWAAQTIALREAPTEFSTEPTAGSYALTGSSATTLYRQLLEPASASYTLTGASADLSTGLAPIVYDNWDLIGATYDTLGALTYDTANIAPQQALLQVTPGSYSLTGASASVIAAQRLETTPGSYSLTGASATVLWRRAAVVTPGAYALTGSTATLLDASLLATTAGSYALTGSAATTVVGRTALTTPGSYTVTGANAQVVQAQVAAVTPGGYSLTGASASTQQSLLALASAGSYALTGASADLAVVAAVDNLLIVSPGSYTLTGQDADLAATGGEQPDTRVHEVEFTDTAPRLWWQRRPKAMPEEVAQEKVAEVARVIRRVASEQVDSPQPVKAQKAQVREAIAPLVAQMPGFDWVALWRALVIEQAAKRQAEQAIERARQFERDEEDALILLMATL